MTWYYLDLEIDNMTEHIPIPTGQHYKIYICFDCGEDTSKEQIHQCYVRIQEETQMCEIRHFESGHPYRQPYPPIKGYSR